MWPPPALPDALTCAPPNSATCGASRSMRPPRLPAASPSARVWLASPNTRVSLACSTIWPLGPTLRLWACTTPCWLTMPPQTSTLPPGAASRPRLSTSPAGTSTRTIRLGSPVSTSSTLRDATSVTLPPGASTLPVLLTPLPSNTICPPKLLLSAPSLRTVPASPASALKRYRPARKSLSFRRSVLVTRLLTSMRASRPKSTPLGLSSQTWPLLDRLPRMAEGSLPVTRLSTLLAAEA